MTIQTYNMPDQSAEYGKYLADLRGAGTLYHERISDGLIAVSTGSDMPDRDAPASVYLGQLQAALDALNYRADFDAAVKSASAPVKAWLNSGGELLTDDAMFAGLIPADKQAQVFKLAATL